MVEVYHGELKHRVTIPAVRIEQPVVLEILCFAPC